MTERYFIKEKNNWSKAKLALGLTGAVVLVGLMIGLGRVIVKKRAYQLALARDDQRSRDLALIARALERYRADRVLDYYPKTGDQSLAQLVDQGYLESVPTDPLTQTQYSYSSEPPEAPVQFRLEAKSENKQLLVLESR